MSYGNRYFHQGEQTDTECHARLYPLLRAGEENQVDLKMEVSPVSAEAAAEMISMIKKLF